MAPTPQWRGPNITEAEGFTFTEALIATVIMLIVASTTVQLFTHFSTSFLLSRQRDAIQGLILNDISQLRQLAKEYCRIPNSGILQPCSGKVATQDWSGSYNPDDQINGDCDQNQLASAMMKANPSLFPSSQTLDTTGGPASLKDVSITRSLNAQGNELSVNYVTTSGSKVTVRTNTTLVPTALGWCP